MPTAFLGRFTSAIVALEIERDKSDDETVRAGIKTSIDLLRALLKQQPAIDWVDELVSAVASDLQLAGLIVKRNAEGVPIVIDWEAFCEKRMAFLKQIKTPKGVIEDGTSETN